MTNWNVLIEPVEDSQVMATVVELPKLQVTAGNRQLAIDEVKRLLSERLSDAEIVSVSVPSAKDENPWRKFAGVFKDDPDFEAIMRDMRNEREGIL